LDTADDLALCLRRWSAEHPAEERLRLIHAVLRQVASSLAIIPDPLPSPSGETFIRHVEHLWELTRWLPGRADFHARPTRTRLRAAMRALARFHTASAASGAEFGVAPAWLDRQRQFEELQRGGWEVIETAHRRPLAPELDVVAGRLYPLARQAARNAALARQLSATPRLALQPAIRDIHHDHVLFTGDEVTGIIDFGTLRIDTPLADIARLVGSLVGDDAEARRCALDAYGELRPLSEADRQIVNVLDESGVILAACNWLTWLYVERRVMGDAAPITRRLSEILQRLSARA
jgi:Ser/Thr protein kinase RdoA (MazF antagonist)